jgi:hypothetical protein
MFKLERLFLDNDQLNKIDINSDHSNLKYIDLNSNQTSNI